MFFGTGLLFLYLNVGVLEAPFMVILGIVPLSIIWYYELIERPREIEVGERVVL